MDPQYDAWNLAIGRYFFKPENAGRTVFLTADDTILHKIGQDNATSLHFDTPEAAAHDFAASVRREIYQRGWTCGILRADRYPIFLGLLAIQVLAVFKMRDDEIWQEKAYWGRLRELLDDVQSRYMPLGLDRDRHQELWRKGLAHWANDIQKERWGTVWLPSQERRVQQHHKHVILPKSQALLSLADLQRLPDFYRRVGFLPGEDLQGADIQDHIQRHRSDPALFQRHAVNVLSDERFPSACAQICDDLRSWDGRNSSVGKARLWLQLSAFHPLELHGGITERTARLQEILGRSQYRYDPRRVFRPIRDTYYVTILDAFNEIWEERRYARPGDDILLLVRSGEANHRYRQVSQFVAENETTQWYHAENEKAPPDQDMLRGLPAGWCALRFRVREDLPASLPGWLSDWLRCDPIQTVGGLRFNKNMWMVGAGPTLALRDPAVKTVLINGESYPVVAGRVTPHQVPCLNESGIYGVRLDGKVEGKRIEIAEADVNIALLTSHGWHQETDAWPLPEWLGQRPFPATPDHGFIVRGPVFLEAPAPYSGEVRPVEQQWLELARCIRDNRFARLSALKTPKAAQSPEHRLLRHLTSVARIRQGLLPRVARPSLKGDA